MCGTGSPVAVLTPDFPRKWRCILPKNSWHMGCSTGHQSTNVALLRIGDNVQRVDPYRAYPLMAVLVLFVAGGCKDLGVNDMSSADNVRIGVIPPATVLGKPAHEVLHIISAKLLLDDLFVVASGTGDSVALKREPLIVDLDLSVRIRDLWFGRVSPGEYERIRLDLHPPEKNAQIADSMFVDPGNDTLRYSVVVSGLYHETPFVFRSRESFRTEVVFPSPISIPVSGVVSLTLIVDPYAWFTEGTLIYDPFNQAQKIEERIRDLTPDAFRDDNRDGKPD